MVLRTVNTAPQRPGQLTLAVEQALASLRAGDPMDAERTLRTHLLKRPDDTLAWGKLGELLRDRGEPREAMLHFRSALRADPEAYDIRLALAHLLHQAGEPHRALEEIGALSETARSRFEARVLEAAVLGTLGRHEDEIAIYELLVRERPDNAPLWMSLGTALKYAGRTTEAVQALRRAVKVRPTYGEGWWSLANLKTVRFEGRDLSAMHRAIRTRLVPQDALHLHFALGAALEQRSQYEESFRHYAKGNAIRAASFNQEQSSVTGFVDRSIEAFDSDLFERFEAKGNPARDPIFVVGLQRSGSTLIEQILASHPMIEGTTELLAMQQLWIDLSHQARQAGETPWQQIQRLDPEALRRIGTEYLDRTRPFRQTNRPLFIDKLPANWMNLGLIRLALPNAKIIDARRHPLACGFSNFKQHYATGVAFAYGLPTIGRFYADYLRMMEHFDRVQPGAVHHVLNERLVDEPVGEVRRLLDFVGVPFDPACVEFHRNRRAVNTPSAEQVRRPINRDGVDYWKRYEPWLGELKAALGSALERWDLLPA
jgi:tetratricopeptide (TPR) repeat protein